MECSADFEVERGHRHRVEQEEVVDRDVLLRQKLDGLLGGATSHQGSLKMGIHVVLSLNETKAGY